SVFEVLFYAFGFLLIGPNNLTAIAKLILMPQNTSTHEDVVNWIYSPRVAVYIFAMIGVMSIFPALMVTFAPLHALIRRLTFLAIGLLTLVGLNELSLYAPYIKELLRAPG